MKTKHKIIFSWLILMAVFVFIYITFRSGAIEKDYLQSLARVTENAATVLESMEKGKPLEQKNLKVFLNRVYRSAETALVAVADREKRVLMAGKNEKYIRSDEAYDTLIGGFTRDEFKKRKDRNYFVRYFHEEKFYIFERDLPDGTLFIVYPFQPGRKILTQMALELLLIIIASVILISLFYILLRSKGVIRDDLPYRVISLDGKKTPLPKDGGAVAQKVDGLAAEPIREYVYGLFRALSSAYAPGTVSMYLVSRKGAGLEKAYELRGNAFLRIDSAQFETMDIRGEIGEELKRSALLLLDSGRKIILPVLHRNSLLAALSLTRERAFRGPEIGEIRARLEETGRQLSEFLLLGDILIDRESGLYSKSYFTLKYDERRKLAAAGGGRFAVILFSLLEREAGLDEEQKTVLFKSIAPKVLGHLGTGDTLSRFDDDLALLIADADAGEAEKTGRKILEELSRVRIRMDRKTTVTLRPCAGLALSQGSAENEDLTAAARKNMEYARGKGAGIIYDGRIKEI